MNSYKKKYFIAYYNEWYKKGDSKKCYLKVDFRSYKLYKEGMFRVFPSYILINLKKKPTIYYFNHVSTF